ncbi:uncharacterized protein Z520_12206 [Fonsecaea multimorphosa CBS 102226]|uniref:Ribosomal RNA-processing protein 7 C-terminal domain-containing protein n=1 Tax=Fonsecaea multimorphosa CBS 102226 TaxID=1442371 RepID=A0A0D2JFW0_9EURO|nr:uncharacterized protein Z520_12206 [Fonsecaea multimorphosa CBS 102226]KIX92052.1 hypothetical protein Z520_12206 [Fonsecaea multimorphosa CBS 102226]OAL17421.1 hypothetical protein AYO22_11644 [Fonsecaea multimorphosa]
MVRVPREVSGCIALPLELPSKGAFSREATHYLYLKPHDPKIPDEDTPRSLFLVNIPVCATERSLKYLFTTQLEGGRIQQVHFSENAPGKQPASATKSSRKRKRMSVEEIEAGLDTYSLPNVFDSEIQKSGASAVVVFVDKPSMELTLKAAQRAAKTGTPIAWEGMAGSVVNEIPRLGLTRYERHKSLRYPSRKELLRSVNAYMTAYSQLEESRSRENARKRALPDEDGFITVTRGSRGSARMDEAKESAEKQKEKAKALEDFYRFQTRERRKQEQDEMVKRFEEDKKIVEEMRARRGKLEINPG